jgi:hypothetical protein
MKDIIKINHRSSLLFGLLISLALFTSFQSAAQKPAAYRLFHLNHYEEKWSESYKKLNYYFINGTGQNKVLKKATMQFKKVNDECIGAEITYFRMKGYENPDIPIIASSSFNAQSKIVNATYAADKLLSPSDKINIDYNGKAYSLYTIKNKNENDSATICFKAGEKETRLAATSFDQDYPARIIYAGDINADNQPDLILQVYQSTGIRWILYLSDSSKQANIQWKEASRCYFTATPC